MVQWPTARAEDAESCGGHNTRQVADSLRAAVTLPTPQASEYKGQSQRGQYSPEDRLTNMVMATAGPQAPDSPNTTGNPPAQWLTPEAQNQEGYQVVNGKRVPRLGAQVKSWSTPRAEERSQHNSQDNGQALSRQIQWATPNAMEGGSISRGGDRKDELLLGGQVKGKLNPRWVCQLMGIPANWVAVDQDDHSHRVDELRLCGNGVVPAQAAKAFHHLIAAFGTQKP